MHLDTSSLAAGLGGTTLLQALPPDPATTITSIIVGLATIIFQIITFLKKKKTA